MRISVLLDSPCGNNRAARASSTRDGPAVTPLLPAVKLVNKTSSSNRPSSGTASSVRLILLSVGVMAVLALMGCAAAYSVMMRDSLSHLKNQDFGRALSKIEKPSGSTNRLLYHLERGLILHYQGDYPASNREFEAAEYTIDKLYTRSVSRGVASLLTNDAIIPYTGEEFERVLIHYYRALNYNHMGDLEAAMVECRKANLRLADYAAEAEYELSYKNDAFVQYMTGLFFEAAGEWNDAYVSYKDAEKGYRAYAADLGTRTPQVLRGDLIRAANALGFDDDVGRYMGVYDIDADQVASSLGNTIVVFIETGLIAEKRQHTIDLPILESDRGVDRYTVSRRAARRYHYPRWHYARVDYWLKVALPEYRVRPSSVRTARVRGSNGEQIYPAVLMEDLDAIAMKSFSEKEGAILTRTVARAMLKYAATEKAEDENEFLGFLVNMFGVSTEAADTRSWLSLPSKIYMARVDRSAGTDSLVVELLNGNGNVVESGPLPRIQVEPDRPVVVSYRSFK